MQYRPARADDFIRLETFVWQTIFPAFDVDGLDEAQGAENDAVVEGANRLVLEALGQQDRRVYTAWDERRRALAGYLVIDVSRPRTAEVVQLIVRRADWGQGIGSALLELALSALDPVFDVITLNRVYNERALTFFQRHGIDDTGERAGDFAIPRRLLMKDGVQQTEATEAPAAVTDDSFPDESDEPVFAPVYEPIADYRLATEELGDLPTTEDSALSEEQQNELTDFISRAKAKKQDAEADAKPLDFSFAFDSAPTTDESDESVESVIDKELEQTTDLRTRFDDRLAERLSTFFGASRLMDYLRLYRKREDFHRIRDVALKAAEKDRSSQERRFGDLIEYFLVKTSKEFHDGAFNQKVLRYQTAATEGGDRFQMVMDYLDFADTDVVYTDFVSAPPRVLRNAAKQFLKASPEERLYFICDQTLLNNGKQGFAMTDRALYWRQVLQPAGVAEYDRIVSTERGKGHLTINRQFFDAGYRLNLRMLLLLDKLSR